tara:strand:- start:6008 stop:6697 length:690 start_codon:yes stop_codon:yes gene_type:complete
MDQEKENSVKSIMGSLNQQDNKQKMGMYFAFIMEFYRVLMGSFLILFVPQKCDNEICGLFENVITGNPVIDTAFSVNIAVFSLFMAMYYAELIRENKMINYLHVNPELPRDNEAVGEALVNLPERKKESILLWDKRYQSAGRIAMVGFIVNLGLSGYVIFLNYLDNKTVTVFLTNALFMGLKLNDVKDVTETDINIFLSAYLTRKIQYNDVDPDKKLFVTNNIVTDNSV